MERANELLAKSNSDNLTIFGASILELARGHLFKLGRDLGLINGQENDEDIGMVINGFSNEAVESDLVHDENANSAENGAVKGTFIRPNELLRVALSSQESFEKTYLEISLKAGITR